MYYTMTNVFQNIHYSAIAEPWQISSHAKQRPPDLQTSPGLRHRHHYLNHQSSISISIINPTVSKYFSDQKYSLSVLFSSFFSPVLFPLRTTFSFLRKCFSLFFGPLSSSNWAKKFLLQNLPPFSEYFFSFSSFPCQFFSISA